MADYWGDNMTGNFKQVEAQSRRQGGFGMKAIHRAKRMPESDLSKQGRSNQEDLADLSQWAKSVGYLPRAEREAIEQARKKAEQNPNPSFLKPLVIIIV